MEIVCVLKTVKSHVFISVQGREHGVDHIPGTKLSVMNGQTEIFDAVDLPADQPHKGGNKLDAPFFEIGDKLCDGELFGQRIGYGGPLFGIQLINFSPGPAFHVDNIKMIHIHALLYGKIQYILP